MKNMDDIAKDEQHILQSALALAEIGIDLKEKCVIGEKYLGHLRNVCGQANRSLSALHSASKASLIQAKRLLDTNQAQRQDTDRLRSLIDRHLDDYEENVEEGDPLTVTDRIRTLELKPNRYDSGLPQSGSNRSVRSETDEKYPENWSRDSSIDLGSVVNLPPVPEDVFSGFAGFNKPKRSSSLSSLKSMRKVKLFLQRAETSDDDEASSDPEDHEICHKGDSEDGLGSGKKHLGNIKEEN